MYSYMAAPTSPQSEGRAPPQPLSHPPSSRGHRQHTTSSPTGPPSHRQHPQEQATEEIPLARLRPHGTPYPHFSSQH